MARWFATWEFDDVPTLLTRGDALYGVDLYDLAILDYTEILKAEPKHVRALRGRAASYSRLWLDSGDRDYGRLAVSDVETLQEAGAATPLELIAMAGWCGDLGDSDNALSVFHQVLIDDPKNVTALQQLAAMQTNFERYDDAVKNTRRCLEIAPDDALARRGLAAALAALGRFAEAAEEFARAGALAEQAYCLAHLDRASEAIELLRRAPAEHRRRPQAYHAPIKALALFRLDRPQDAMDCVWPEVEALRSNGAILSYVWIWTTSPCFDAFDDEDREWLTYFAEFDVTPCWWFGRPAAIRTKAAAYAATGDFESAVATMHEMLALPLAWKRDAAQRQLECYESRRLYRSNELP